MTKFVLNFLMLVDISCWICQSRPNPFVSLLANTSISLSFPQIHRRVRRQDLILDGNQDWCAAQVVAEPCENGGVCRSQTSGYTCDCIDGYWGFRCEFDPNFNPCESSGNPCMNNGICVPDKEAQRAEDNNVVQGPFLCVCKKGYGGRVCETNLHEAKCREDFCTNRGTVRIGPKGECRCECNEPELYYGDQCENERPCAAYPCLNGGRCSEVTLPNGTLSYECHCQLLYRGNDCEIVEEESQCSFQNPCQNGATCVISEIAGGEFGGAQQVQCHCTSNFTGPQCEINLQFYDPCQDQSDEQQQCVTDPNCYLKEFVENKGKKFQKCFNGGVCMKNSLKPTDFFCNCPVQYTGGRCELKNPCYDENFIYQCTDGSVCIPIPNAENLQYSPYKPYACLCAPGQVGPHCTDPSKDRDCNPNPCKFGGQCISCANYDIVCKTAAEKNRGYVCNCERGHTGVDCDDQVNFCGSHQCENRAECVSAPKDPKKYRCICPAGYSGEYCELVENICLAVDLCIYGHCKITQTFPGFRCDCFEGYEGQHCSFDKNRRFRGDFKAHPYEQVMIFSGTVGGIISGAIVLWAFFTCYRARLDRQKYEKLQTEEP